jgi:hypothetical protein
MAAEPAAFNEQSLNGAAFLLKNFIAKPAFYEIFIQDKPNNCADF